MIGFFYLVLFSQRCTCLGVASSVANRFQSRYDDAFVIVSVEFEFCLGIIAVLHQRNLSKKTKRFIGIFE